LIRLAAYKRTRGREGKAIKGGRQWAPPYFWQVYAYGHTLVTRGCRNLASTLRMHLDDLVYRDVQCQTTCVVVAL